MLDADTGPCPIKKSEVLENKLALRESRLIIGGNITLGMFEVADKKGGRRFFHSVQLLNFKNLGGGKPYTSKRWLSLTPDGDLTVIDVEVGIAFTVEDKSIREVSGWGKYLVGRDGRLFSVFGDRSTNPFLQVETDPTKIMPPAFIKSLPEVYRIDLFNGGGLDIIVIDWRTNMLLPRVIKPLDSLAPSAST